MNILVRELKANLRSLIVWGVIVSVFVMEGVTELSAYHGNPELLAVLDAFPPQMMAAFGFKGFNWTTVSGFFGVMFTYFALLLGIAAAMWGSDIISKEERDRTAELLLTLPVTRRRVLTAKFLAALILCLALLLITWAVCLAGARQYHPDSAFYRFWSLCMLAVFIIQMIFLTVGLFAGCAMKQYRRSGGVAVSLLLATYFLSIITSLNADLDGLKYLTPFRYFDAAMMLRESRIDGGFVLLSLTIIAAGLIGAYVTYQRRDMSI